MPAPSICAKTKRHPGGWPGCLWDSGSGAPGLGGGVYPDVGGEDRVDIRLDRDEALLGRAG